MALKKAESERRIMRCSLRLRQDERDVLAAFADEKNLKYTEIMRLALRKYLRDNGCDLPGGDDIIPTGPAQSAISSNNNKTHLMERTSDELCQYTMLGSTEYTFRGSNPGHPD